MATVIFSCLGIILAGEVLIHLLLFIISKAIGKTSKDRINVSTIFKGILERSYVTIVSFLNMVPALTLLGALKIATRIKDEENKVSNDFFLIGNLVSILFGISYFLILKYLLAR
jgi:hypothetical protein